MSMEGGTLTTVRSELGSSTWSSISWMEGGGGDWSTGFKLLVLHNFQGSLFIYYKKLGPGTSYCIAMFCFFVFIKSHSFHCLHTLTLANGSFVTYHTHFVKIRFMLVEKLITQSNDDCFMIKKGSANCVCKKRTRGVRCMQFPSVKISSCYMYTEPTGIRASSLQTFTCRARFM